MDKYNVDLENLELYDEKQKGRLRTLIDESPLYDETDYCDHFCNCDSLCNFEHPAAIVVALAEMKSAIAKIDHVSELADYQEGP